MRHTIAAGVLAAGTIASLAACGPTNSAGISDPNIAPSASVPGVVPSAAHSIANSTQGKAAKAAGKAAIAGCQPAGDSTIQWQGQLALYPSARTALENCLGIKDTTERKNLGRCVLRVAKAELNGSGQLSAREAVFLADVQRACVK